MHYRFYEIDPSNHVMAGYSVGCPSDAAAIEAARRLGQQRAAVVEVWEATRLAGRLSAAAAMLAGCLLINAAAASPHPPLS